MIGWHLARKEADLQPGPQNRACSARFASTVPSSAILRDPSRKLPYFLSIIALAAVSIPLLAGCFGQDDSKKPWMVHDQKCEQLGFRRGTPEHANCGLELARKAMPRGGRTGRARLRRRSLSAFGRATGGPSVRKRSTHLRTVVGGVELAVRGCVSRRYA
jgi:hypothetical protein